jgi:hypothetical protein
MPRRLPSTLVLAASAAAALALPAAATSRPAAVAAAAPSCHNLTVDAGLRRALTRAHARPREGAISRGSIYYGRCGQTRYAIAGFSKAGGDQPEKFRRQPGKPWRDFGDGFEDGCSNARYPIPRALVLIWGFCQR